MLRDSARPDVLFCSRAQICPCTYGQSLATTVQEDLLAVQMSNLSEDTSREHGRSACCRRVVGSLSADHLVVLSQTVKITIVGVAGECVDRSNGHDRSKHTATC